MIASLTRRSVVLAASIGTVIMLSACDSASVTQPDVAAKKLQPSARHDDVCLTGYILSDGRMVCQD